MGSASTHNSSFSASPIIFLCKVFKYFLPDERKKTRRAGVLQDLSHVFHERCDRGAALSLRSGRPRCLEQYLDIVAIQDSRFLAAKWAVGHERPEIWVIS